uniref:Uncharacterized protein LOC111105175 n=1 Tax=Crassostrea virginica TaxID=6565 RepID=A0A8B8AUR1_CRAVI|nr:uncharacterized protein LOC111105175 [Crassostrea virginica]
MLIKLERLSIKVDLLDFLFGTTHHYSLVGLLRADLRLQDIPYLQEYVVDLTISACWESSGACTVVETVLDGTRLPKTFCDWSAGLQGFSLQNWLSSKGESGGGSTLPDYVQYILLEERGISNMMKDSPCSKIPAAPRDNSTTLGVGWKSDCSSLPMLPDLPSEITCYNPDSCTALTCCMEIAKLDKRLIEVSVILDECSNTLTVSIERISQTVYLHEFSYGTEYRFSLKGVFEIKYTISQNMMDRKYEFHVDVSACYEPLSCDQVVSILNQTSFDMKSCTYQGGFLNSNFSLGAWLTSRAIASVDAVTVPQASQLLVELGLDHYLDSTDRCSLSDKVYGAAGVNGWVNECESLSNYTLPAIPHKDKVLCHIPSSCDQVSCCVYMAPVRRHARVDLVVNTCSYQMEAVIDNLRFTRSLFTYTWGTMEEIGAHGVLKFRFHVTNVVTEKKVKVDGNINLCFEPSNCTEVLSFNDLPISYSNCSAAGSRPVFEGISFDFWKQTQCGNYIFDLNACTNAQIEGIPAEAQTHCRYLSDCSGIECCMENQFSLGTRRVYSMTRMDCDHLEIQVENKRIQKSLTALTDGVMYIEQIGDPVTFQVNYTKIQNGANYALGVVLSVLGVMPDSPGSGVSAYNLMDLNTTRITPAGCGTGKRRRRKRSIDLSKLDPERFIGSIRTLHDSNADNEKYDAFFQQMIDQNKLEKAKNLAAIPLSDNDVTTGLKSQVQALGSGNPFTIKTTEESPNSVTLQGEDAIANAMSTSVGILGREQQAYIVGSGVTARGAKLLAQKLACMTIGDLDALLQLKNIDPLKVALLLGKIQELAKALYSEFISKLFADGNSIFKSFDMEIMGDFSFPRQHGTLFEFGKTIPVGGFLMMNFGFGIDFFYGVKFDVGVRIMEMKGIVQVEPYGGLMVWGELGIGAALYGKLRLEGFIMDIGFPTKAEVTFNKFPLDVRLKMFLRLTPIKLRLYALVTLEIDVFIGTIKLTLFKVKLWQYQTATIRKPIIDNSKPEEDLTPPQLQTAGGSTPPGSCGVIQLAGRDHTSPEFIITVMAEDDRSNVNLHLDIGTVPGGSNVMSRRQLGGFSTALNDVLDPAGVPLYFTVHVSNEAGVSVPATCRLDTFDITIPGGRMAEAFISTSNPNVLKGVVTVYEDSPLQQTMVAAGYGKGIWGEQVVRWNATTVAANTVNYDVGQWCLTFLKFFMKCYLSVVSGTVNMSEGSEEKE